MDERTVLKIINLVVCGMRDPRFTGDKLDGSNKVEEDDKTMLNFKCKSQSGRSPSNKTDALCNVKVENNIKRV